ncbi:MAG TPA: hypothetical protein VET83_02970 [Candidatus Dormibacteraeota bacterium]|nr:hypothetical protein [Candidatus Dormibacteraeota bacterium]
MNRSTKMFLLRCALVVLAGCAPVSAVAATRPATGVPGLPSVASATAYASLEAARDSVGKIVWRCLNHADSTVRFSREAVTFDYRYAKTQAHGWAFEVFANELASGLMGCVQEALTAAGWVEHYGYMADGADGSNEGYLSRNFFCLIEGDWDGGDDADSTYVPQPGCHVVVTCVPRREDDFPPP